MFCFRTSNNMINKIHERSLILILNDQTSDFDRLLQNNNDTCNHHRYIQPLLIEIEKINNNLHYVKTVRIWSFSGPYFSAFGLNMKRYGVFSPNAGKYRSEKLQIRILFTQC